MFNVFCDILALSSEQHTKKNGFNELIIQYEHQFKVMKTQIISESSWEYNKMLSVTYETRFCFPGKKKKNQPKIL